MKNKAILFSLMLVASGAVLAEQSLVEGVAKQAVTDKATEVAPVATDALQDQAKEVVKEKATEVVPAEAEKAGEAVKTGKEATKNLKGKVEDAPKSTKALKGKAKHKVVEKALELPK
jgi:hypothetical protein